MRPESRPSFRIDAFLATYLSSARCWMQTEVCKVSCVRAQLTNSSATMSTLKRGGKSKGGQRTIQKE